MNRFSLTVCFLIIFNLLLSSQSKIKLWDDSKGTKKMSELYIFIPEKSDTSGISVIICPGGSYYWLPIQNEGISVAQYLNKQGITAFVLRYRTAMFGNHYPAMFEDLQRAMQIVKTNSKQYGIDPEKVGVMGFSAGGHLAGTLAIYADNDLKPYFAAMIYPVVSMQDSISHKESKRSLIGKNYSAELKQKLSLELNVYSDMPPIFLLHCKGDKTVDYRNSVVFDKALTEKNVKHLFLLLDEKGHGFGIQPNGKATGWIDNFISWMYKLGR